MPVRGRIKRRLKPAALWVKGRRDPFVRLQGPNAWRNPYAVYEAMRSRAPVYHSPTANLYVLTGYEHASFACKDNRFVVESAGGENAVSALGSPDSLLKLNPPRHTQIRKLVSKAFSARAIEALSDWVTDRTHELLDTVTGEREFDVVKTLAYPLPLGIITSRILGVPDPDAEQFSLWGRDIGPVVFVTPEKRRAGRAASEAMSAYLQQLVDERRRLPGDDMLSVLVAATEDGVQLTDNELLVNCQLLIVAGFGTTTSMISSGMDLLVDRPHLWTLMQQRRELVPNAIEEILRIESPIQMTPRHVKEDVDLLGYHVPAGNRVLIVEAAANRDPSVFPKPSEFDIFRENASKNLAFAGGAHYCLGAALARLQGRIVLEAMLERLPAINRAGPSRRRDTLLSRGLNVVPVGVPDGVQPRAALSAATDAATGSVAG